MRKITVFIFIIFMFFGCTSKKSPSDISSGGRSTASEECPISFDQNVTQIGDTDAQVIAKRGTPRKVFEYTKPQSQSSIIYEQFYKRQLAYGKPAFAVKGFRIFDWNYYSLGEDKTVIGFANTYSNLPSNMNTVKEMYAWVDQVKWDIINLDNPGDTSFPPSLTAYFQCGDTLIKMEADCWEVKSTDMNTYQPKLRNPDNLGECRYRGFSVLKSKFVKKRNIKIVPFDFKTGFKK